ncbi:hypothetical protein HW130_03345 [Streptomyces sp. PKU-EA00015]|uniref:hypothetical protein n=1 Tax=Streptomyces sp. PKU-EA00015 TaxID=2748326 RepID=UPI0017E988B8|nr:hypothetical protein [Streptomyces sp. PKU-EA00015]NWF25308.1 hypothetical protein [Streptomyces sp. PKU-EA00015]
MLPPRSAVRAARQAAVGVVTASVGSPVSGRWSTSARTGHDAEPLFGEPDDCAYVGVVRLRAARLEAGERGEVWADERAVPSEEFEERADDVC